MEYLLKFGLGGGFGYNYEILDTEFGIDYANREAYYKACDHYDEMAGANDIRSEEDIVEEDEVEMAEAEEIYREERENWIDYEAVEYDPDLHDEYLYSQMP